MLCEKILGKTTDKEFADKKIDYVEIEWHETYNKIHRKTSSGGKDIAIRFDDTILHHGVKPGDVIGVDSDGTVIAVDVPETKILCASIQNPTSFNIAKIAYEIGNCHAPLFAGEKDNELITVYDRPMEVLLNKLNGVSVNVKTQKLDFSKQISSTIGHSHHEHHHDEC